MQTYDVAAFQTKLGSTAPVPQQLWELDEDGRVITGILKLQQRFLLALLTVRETLPFYPEVGSSLLTFARAGRIRNDIDAYVFFNYAVGEVEQQLLAETRDTDEPDEQFASAELVSVTFTFERLVYQIRLTSVAGTSRELLLPIKAVP